MRDHWPQRSSCRSGGLRGPPPHKLNRFVAGHCRIWVLQKGRIGSSTTRVFQRRAQSVGVAWQSCRQLGKQDDCQVAVSLSVATTEASLPVSYQPYLPKEWAEEPVRRQLAGVRGICVCDQAADRHQTTTPSTTERCLGRSSAGRCGLWKLMAHWRTRTN